MTPASGLRGWRFFLVDENFLYHSILPFLEIISQRCSSGFARRVIRAKIARRTKLRRAMSQPIVRLARTIGMTWIILPGGQHKRLRDLSDAIHYAV